MFIGLETWSYIDQTSLSLLLPIFRERLEGESNGNRFLAENCTTYLTTLFFSLKVLVQPAEKFIVPHHCILGSKHLVSFVLKCDQT